MSYPFDYNLGGFKRQQRIRGHGVLDGLSYGSYPNLNIVVPWPAYFAAAYQQFLSYGLGSYSGSYLGNPAGYGRSYLSSPGGYGRSYLSTPNYYGSTQLATPSNYGNGYITEPSRYNNNNAATGRTEQKNNQVEVAGKVGEMIGAFIEVFGKIKYADAPSFNPVMNNILNPGVNLGLTPGLGV